MKKKKNSAKYEKLIKKELKTMRKDMNEYLKRVGKIVKKSPTQLKKNKYMKAVFKNMDNLEKTLKKHVGWK